MENDQYKVNLISITPNAEDHIVYCARVSSKKQDSENAERLIRYLIKNKHWSPFEMSNMCVEVVTSRMISPQILRHRSFNFQEFCIAGDSKITFELPNGLKNKKRVAYTRTIQDIYKKFHKNEYLKNIIKKMNVRIYDENNQKFITAHIKDVFKTGTKECFKVVLEDGKTIVCTKEHKFLTKNGFFSLQKITNLKKINNSIVFKNDTPVGVNGIVCYQDYEWLKNAKSRNIENKLGLFGIAQDAGVSVNTIRKWLKKLKLSFTKKEVSLYTPIWNKGKSGYKNKSRTLEQKEYMKQITPTGKNHHAWKGGGASERKALANYFNSYRKQIFANFNYKCQLCLESFNKFDGKIDLHHIKEVSLYPELAKDINNVIPVHRKCHMEYHGKSYYFKEILKLGKRGNPLIPRWIKIKSIEYVGMQDTYDLEIDHSSHNYVANKIVVHNSQRYSAVDQCIIYEARLQDDKNRQNSIEIKDNEIQEWWSQTQKMVWEYSYNLYQKALEKKIAKELARGILPGISQTKLEINGTIRSWIHYLQVRTEEGVQKEHKQIAEAIKTIFYSYFPNISKALEWI